MDMAITDTAKYTEILPETKQIKALQYQVKALTGFRPLPEGRPIASNNSEGIAEVLGYLD